MASGASSVYGILSSHFIVKPPPGRPGMPDCGNIPELMPTIHAA